MEKNLIARFGRICISAAGLMLAFASLSAAEEKPAPQQAKDVEVFSEKLKDDKRFVGVFPPHVKTIVCISPASCPAQASRRGLELLRKAGYKVKVMPHAFEYVEPDKDAEAAKRHLAAPLEARLEDFYAAWNDPEADMILCIRGGRGCRDLLAKVDWKKLKPRKDLYVHGYSDVTQITAALLAKGYGHPVAGPMAGSMIGLNQTYIKAMRDMYNGAQVGPIPVRPLVPGDCSGLPLTGLLSRLAWVVESDYCPDTTGRIIFIEVVASSPDKVRKDLDLLISRGFFAKAKAVVFGHFLRSGKLKELAAIRKEYAPKLGIPVYEGFPFGHSRKCCTIDFSRPVEIKDNAVIFPAVAKKQE